MRCLETDGLEHHVLLAECLLDHTIHRRFRGFKHGAYDASKRFLGADHVNIVMNVLCMQQVFQVQELRSLASQVPSDRQDPHSILSERIDYIRIGVVRTGPPKDRRAYKTTLFAELVVNLLNCGYVVIAFLRNSLEQVLRLVLQELPALESIVLFILLIDAALFWYVHR